MAVDWDKEFSETFGPAVVDDYDMEGAKAAGIKPDERGHYPDTFKRPNHITFSTDSKYSNDKTPGGVWKEKSKGKWTYTPSDYVLSQHPAEELQRYFEEKEPDAELILPKASSSSVTDWDKEFSETFGNPTAPVTQSPSSMPSRESQVAAMGPGRHMEQVDNTLGTITEDDKRMEREAQYITDAMHIAAEVNSAKGKAGQRTQEDYEKYASDVAKRSGHFDYKKNDQFINSVKPMLDAYDLLRDEGVAVKTPPELRPYVLEAMQRTTAAADKKHDRGILSRTLDLGTASMVGAANALNRFNPALSEEQKKFQSQLSEIQTDPQRFIHPDQGFISRNTQSAVSALIPMAATGGSVGGTGLVFGLPTAVRTEESAKERGASPSAALAAGATAGAAETALFSFIPGRVLGSLGQGWVGKVTENALGRYALESLKTGSLMTAAGLQQKLLEEGAVRSGGGKKNENIWEETVSSLPDTAFQALILHVPGLVKGIATLPDKPSRAQFEAAGGTRGLSAEDRAVTVKNAKSMLTKEQPIEGEPTNASKIQEPAKGGGDSGTQPPEVVQPQPRPTENVQEPVGGLRQDQGKGIATEETAPVQEGTEIGGVVETPIANKNIPSKYDRNKESEQEGIKRLYQVAENNGIDPIALRTYAEKAAEERAVEAKDYNLAINSIMKSHGLTPSKIRKMEAGDYDKIKGFDETARSAANDFPQLGLRGNPDEAAGPLWELLKAGKKQIPKWHDQKILDEASFTGDYSLQQEAETGRGDAWEPPDYGRTVQKAFISKEGLPGQQDLFNTEGSEPTEAFGPKSKIPVPVNQVPLGGKTRSTGDVVKEISSAFDVPIRTGHFRRPMAAGIYKKMEEVARTKGYGDIAVASHEVAHHLAKTTDLLKLLPLDAKAEAKKLDYKPNRGDVEEGIAEYVRHALTMDDAAKVAPQLDAWFQGTFLAGNKKAADAFTRSRSVVDTWRNAGAVNRVVAQIDSNSARFSGVKKLLKAPKNIGEWVVNNWFNRLAPLQKAAQEMVGLKKSYLNTADVMKAMDADVNFWAFAKVSNLASAAKARSWAKFGTADVQGNRTGAGLEEVFAPIARDLQSKEALDQFYAYAYARHAIDVIANGKEPGILLEDAKRVIQEFEGRPGWKDASDGLTNWHNSLIDYLVDAGGLPKESADAMKQTYPHYISLARKMEGEFTPPASGGGARYAETPQGVYKLKGSGREIIAPLESAMAYAERIIGVADKVRVGRMLVDAAAKYGKLGDMVEKVDADLVPHTTSMDILKKQLENAGADLSGADMDATLTMFSQVMRGDPKDNILLLYRDGKRQAYWIRPDLYKSLMAYDKPYKLPAIIDQTFGRVARTIRLGATGLRAGFSLLTNPMRDLQTALLQTEYQSKNPFSVTANAVRGFVSDIVGDETAQLWKRGGGEMAQPLGIDRKFTQEAVSELMAQNPKAKVLNWANHPIDSLRSLFSITESAPRLAEYRAALEKTGWKPGQPITFEQYVKAQLAAANVTTDFREGGNLAMWINQINPFFNANIQGPARMASAIRNHPVASITNAALWITLPTLALWWNNKDEEWYKNMDPLEKYRYWHVKIGSKIIRIPKPFEWGHVFSSMPEGALESTYRGDPQAFNEATGKAIDDLTPSIIPGAIEPGVEIAANKDYFTNKPLIPKRLEKANPEDQVAPNTTETAKKIGSLLGVSPIYVEHLASSYTGGLALEVMKSAEKITGIGSSPPKREASAIPVIGRLFMQDTHTRVINDFYNKIAELEKVTGSAKLNNKKAFKESGQLKIMNKAADEMSGLRKKSRSILANEKISDDAKRKEFINIHIQMVEIAAKANARASGGSMKDVVEDMKNLKKRLLR